MRIALIVVFLVAMVVAASNPEFKLPMYRSPIGIMNVNEHAVGIREEQTLIPDMLIIDGYRPVKVVTKIQDKHETCRGDFPLQAIAGN